MAIEVNSILSNVNNKVYSIPGLNKIFSNVIYTSLIISIISLIIVLFIQNENLPMWISVKVFLYIFITCITILSIHNGILKDKYIKLSEEQKADKLMKVVDGGSVSYMDEGIKVSPNLEIKELPKIEYSFEPTQPQSVDDILNSI